MATQLLEDKLTCPICVGLYQDSVTLLCGHFCRTCIRDWWSRREMACPECQEPVADRAEPPRKVAISGVLEVVFAGAAPAPNPHSHPRSPSRTPALAPPSGPSPALARSAPCTGGRSSFSVACAARAPCASVVSTSGHGWTPSPGSKR